MEDLVAQLLTLMKGVWKYRWYAMAIAWITLVVGWAVLRKIPDNYQASARVFVDTQSILKPLLSGMTTVPNVEQQVSIMSRTLLSRPNIERVIRMVDLDIKTKTVVDHEKLIDDLITKIKIGGTVQNDIYTISYNDESAKIAKDVVQSLLTIFVEGSFGNKRQDSTKAIQFIDEQIKMYEEKLTTAENELKNFKLKNLSLLPKLGGDYGTKLGETSDTLSQAKLELLEAEQARNAIKKQIYGDDSGLKKDSPPPNFSNPDIDARIASLNKTLDSLRLQFTEEHPDIVAIKRLIAQLEVRNVEESKQRKIGADPGANFSPMLQQLRVALSDAEAKVASLKARVNEYSMRTQHLKSMSVAAPEVESQLAQLNRDYQVNKINYEKLVASRESAKLSGELNDTTEMMTFRIIDPPTVPPVPSSPKRPLIFSGLFVASLLIGAAGAFLLGKIRPTFLSQNELMEVTGLPILGAVSMNWTDQENRRHKKSLIALGISFFLLLSLYVAVMTRMVFYA